ncbi:response regulator transcription factor [Massilia sp. 9I]|uniref:response regulator n=1 Tax=Massilia sp. 9I TaxID=2653152 RepID=UPI0012F209E4|nr:response regulator transcription factor [Massilia sp. 9I]VXC12875.1 Two Component Transcriptional Regulator, LuxR family [Massilia sp. 9I]
MRALPAHYNSLFSPQPTMIRVVIADDHQLVREGVKKVLSADPDIALVGEAADLASTLAVLDAVEVDLLLLDLTLSPAHELDALRTVVARFPTLRVLVLSSHSEERFGISALRLGAAGYITKSLTVDLVLKAIRKVHAGGRYLSENMADLLAYEVSSPQPRHAHERLTDRELQVTRLLALGHPVKQVAARLDISVSSVNTYRGRIFEKLALKSNAELIRYAIHHKLVN